MFSGYSLASLQVEKFGLGINPSRLQLRFGTDLPLRRWTKIGVTPIIELAADFAMGDTDTDFDNTGHDRRGRRHPQHAARPASAAPPPRPRSATRSIRAPPCG